MTSEIGTGTIKYRINVLLTRSRPGGWAGTLLDNTAIEMELLLTFWHRLLDDLNLRRNSPRQVVQLRLEGEPLQAVWDLAERDGKPAEQVARELISFALAHRAAAEENLRRWRRLSPREQEVAALVCKGYTNTEIAVHLSISAETVKTHVRNSVRKLGLNTRYDLRLALEDWDFSAWPAPASPKMEDDLEI